MAKNLLITILILALAGSVWMQKQVREVEAVREVEVIREVPVVREPDEVTVVLVEEGDPLEEVLGRMKADLPGAVVGFCLLDEDGKVISEMDGGMPMIPASTFKTLTTVASLDLLGPEFQFVTELKSETPVEGVISNDLLIRGGGDPMLSMVDLEKMADALKEKGLSSIKGGVIGDGSLFQGTMAGDFWGWGDVGNGYGSPTSGLNLEHNRYVAVFRPGAALGDSTQFVGARPEVPGVEWLNQVKTGAEGSGDGVMIYGGPLATRIHLTGTVPPGDEFAVRGAVPNPPEFAAFHLDRLLRERGIQIGKRPRAMDEGQVFKGEHLWLAHRSPSLAEILPGLHGRSDNHETECLFQMMSVKAGRPAAEVLTEYWKERGVDGIRVVDGSGLSRADFVSAEGLARVQWVASQAEHAVIYRESLSPGLSGKAHWKGGAMSSVRSWAGYLDLKAGERLSFALIFNHYQDGSRLDGWRDVLAQEALRVVGSP